MNPTSSPASRAPLLHLPVKVLPALHRALGQDLSPEESAMLVRELGFDTGEAFHEAFSDWLEEGGEGEAPASLAEHRFWSLLAEFFTSLGWGTLRLETPHAAVVSLSSPEWAEAEERPGALHPSCHLTTGLLSDLMGRVAGTDLAVMEVECRTRGDAECRFLLGSPEALELVHGRLRAGATYPGALDVLG